MRVDQGLDARLLQFSRSGMARAVRRLRALALTAVGLSFLAACTAAAPPARPTEGASAASTASPATASFQPGQLSCIDAYTKEMQGGKAVLTASGVGFEALSKAGFDPIPAEGALPWEASGGYFSKSPIYLDDRVAWAEVTAITGEVRFAWVPSAVWTGQERATGDYETASVRLESCNDSYTGFLGGILTPTAHACITLGIRSNLHPDVEPFRVAIGKGTCS
ncbi:MAG: hypothetical protein QM779_00970 [Propionicimonas sp.]|uniref:hypothetical protein n=1 Tax=Propionicimonas sp. TaxID=1955623 RepID=UPI003D11B7B0